MFKILKILAMLCALLVAVGAGGFYWLASSPIPLASERAEFHVTYGKGMSAVAREIAASGVPVDPWMLILLGKVYGVESSIKAGSYEISRGVTPLELLRKLTSGDVTQGEIVFIEGWNFRQIRARLEAHPDLRHDTRGLPEAEIMRMIGAPASSAEGMFFPDTYLFSKQTSDVDVLARAYRAMQQQLSREWAARAAGLPYADPYQALIMASIVEKETGRQEDRSYVASVFVNRLRLGMRLQTDPTVIYGVGEDFDGNLRKRDLLADTPYNTYTRAGLPPTPIAMPGLASLRAAVNPAPGRALYFVARGDGSSQFSETLEQHNQAVNRYQRRGQRTRDGGDK
ncbi:endolytic transglycosylase MltG [Propionivibrio limicola]|uniref:endolytic transglycosylase MltG n=1 Tax=Propionivibrio limicola TaxID=167645 RepID=UPI0012914D05|nr:endolytic transglycosylase MltG [Propionivibrio limicola]